LDSDFVFKVEPNLGKHAPVWLEDAIYVSNTAPRGGAMPSSAENVLAAVRSQILTGARKPGEKISEVGVAAEFTVSRPPAPH